MNFRRLFPHCKHVQCFIRVYSNIAPKYSKSDLKTPLNRSLHEAENVVGYPTSFLSLRWILNDEIANVASQIKKLIGTDHPLLKTAINLLMRNEVASWGLVVLLMSKVAGLNSKFPELECDKIAGILHSQRSVAEVTEMLKTSYMIHKGIINIDPKDSHLNDLNFGNNLGILCGDYLLAKCFHEMALLRNSQVQELLSTTMRDHAEVEFLGIQDSQNEPLPSKPEKLQNNIPVPYNYDSLPYEINKYLGNMKSEWILRNILSSGSLLGRACQCSLVLARHDLKHQRLAFKFGRDFALAWQARIDKNSIKQEKFSLVSAPVMFHLECDPSLYGEIEKGHQDINDVNYDLIRNVVISGSGLEKTEQLQKEFSESALCSLSEFCDSDSKTALVKILMSL